MYTYVTYNNLPVVGLFADIFTDSLKNLQDFFHFERFLEMFLVVIFCSSLLEFNILFLFCIYEILWHIFIHILCLCLVSTRGHWMPVTCVTDGCEPLSGCWEGNWGPLQGQQMPLSTEPSLCPRDGRALVVMSSCSCTSFLYFSVLLPARNSSALSFKKENFVC